MPEGKETEQKTEEKTVDLDAIASGLESIKNELAAEKESRARLQGTVESLSQSRAQPEPKPQKRKYSRAELSAAVEAGTITDEQRQGYLEETLREEIRAEMHREIESAKGNIQSENESKAELEKYIEAVPTIMEQGSEDRARVQTEYNKLVADGFPESIKSQLLAVRLAIGPVPKNRTDIPGERQTDKAGAGGGGAHKAQDDNDPLKGLNVDSRKRAHYAKLVDSGVYQGWDQVRAELKDYQGPRAS